MTLAHTDTIKRGNDHVETEVGDQTMMMSISKGKYFALEETGRRIWTLTEHPTTIGRIVETLVEEYEIGHETCAAEVGSFVDDLIENGLLVKDEAAPAA